MTDSAPWDDEEFGDSGEDRPSDGPRPGDTPPGASRINPWSQADRYEGTLFALPGTLGLAASCGVFDVIFIAKGGDLYLAWAGFSSLLGVWFLVRCTNIVVQWLKRR
jgi:hypothetical protein